MARNFGVHLKDYNSELWFGILGYVVRWRAGQTLPHRTRFTINTPPQNRCLYMCPWPVSRPFRLFTVLEACRQRVRSRAPRLLRPKLTHIPPAPSDPPLPAMSDSSASVAVCPFRLRSASIEIPQELFDPILWHATQMDPRAPQHDMDSYVRSLASLNLISTHFAKYCRPRIYEFVILANQRRLEGLLAILHSGCKPLGKYLTEFARSITIRYSESADTFWALRAVRVITTTMRYAGAKHLPDVAVDMGGVLLPGLVPGQTQLPCSLPSSIFQYVRQLDLRSVRFERGDDFLQCLLVLRNLSAISLHGCRSATPLSPVTLGRIPTNCYANLQRVSGLVPDLDTDTCCATMLLQVLFDGGGRNSCFLSCVQAPAVVDLIQAIFGSGSSTTHSGYAWNLTIEDECKHSVAAYTN